MFEISFLDSLPPFMTALIAIVYIFLWQMGGASLTYKILPSSNLKNPTKFCIAWVVFPCLAGSFVALLYVLKWNNSFVLSFLTAVILFYGAFKSLKIKNLILNFCDSQRSKTYKWLNISMFIMLVFALLSAAHPQRLYDQLNYHLVIPKHLILYEFNLDSVLDIHKLLVGSYELSLTWFGTLFFNDFLFIACGQFYTFFLMLTTAIFIAYNICLKDQINKFNIFYIFYVLGICLFLHPDLLTPKLAKSEGLLWAQVFCILYLFVKEDIKDSLPFILLLFLVSLSVKITSIHAILAIILTLMFIDPKFFKIILKSKKYIYILGILSFSAIVLFRISNSGTPLFPADIPFFKIFGIEEYDLAYQYFKEVAFSQKRSLSFHSFLGSFYLLKENISLFVGVLSHLLISFYLKISFSKEEKKLLLFFIFFSLIWPFFYSPNIFPRFVIPLTAAFHFYLINLYPKIVVKLSQKHLNFYQILCFILISSSSYFDVDLRMFFLRNKTSTYNSMKKEFPRLETDRYLLEKIKGEKVLVLSDDPIKYFLPYPFIIPKPLSSREKILWESLLKKDYQILKSNGFNKIVSILPKENLLKNKAIEGFSKNYEKRWRKWILELRNQDKNLIINEDYISILDLDKL